MTKNHGAHLSHHREAATPAAGSTAQSAAARPAKPSPTHHSSATPTDAEAPFEPRRWPLMIFVVVVTAMFLAACITTFFSVGLPLLTEIIDWF